MAQDQVQGSEAIRRGGAVLAAAGRGRWLVSLYPDAGEAGGFFESARARAGYEQDRVIDRPGRAEAEAGRRAVTRIRRYCAANRLNRLGTLTYAGEGCHDPARLRSDVASYWRLLRGELGGGLLAYLWVAEWHPGGHGLHVHFAVGRFVPRRRIEAAWPHGFVHIKLLGNLPVGSSELAEARLAAGYLSSSYLSKQLDDARLPGLHRYEVAQGFQPRRLRFAGSSVESAIGTASAEMGRAPSRLWLSPSVEGWQAPPAVWAQWD